jgi:tRNA A-37 threonylcarbamoyl transferase component Bud32/tetratricopeptide (TPR) repeat protein
METLFHEALNRPEDKREEWLQSQCGDDTALFQNTLALLLASQREQEASKTLQGSSTKPSVAGKRLGPYELISLLGRGGMGAVYLAHRADGQYEKRVAIKLVDLPLATELFFERFRQERQILAGLDHPGIARMLDGGVSDDGILYLVLEYVDGVPIDDYVRTHSISLEEKLKLFVKVCKAVQFAHQNLVIHRDLKPDNILVSADGEPHLLDFGTAKLLSPDRAADVQGLTRHGFLSFTPAYASPEQVLGKPITTAADTYSLGVMLYLLLTSKLPYELSEFTTEEMVGVICEQAPAPPTSTDGTFPNADLEAILAKALRKEPEQRYGTAEQLASDVEAYLEHRPVLARKGTLRYKATKFARRNKLAISFACVLLVMLLAGIFAVLQQARAARRAEQRAEARSVDLLQLSDSLLSELDTAIQQLPGSTGAQQLLVARVLEHLERIAADARMDTQTGVTLANAYVRLGNLQGDPYEQNTGDTPGAIRSIHQAISILEALAKSHPNDASVLTALARAETARGEILSQADDNDGAAASMQAASAAYEQLLALPNPTPLLCFETAVSYETYGDLLGQDTGFGDGMGALTFYRKAIEMDQRALTIDPNSMRVRRGLPVMQVKVGNVHLDINPAEALLDFQKGMELLNALPPSERAVLSSVRLRALLLRKEANALSELGRYTEARPLFAQSEEIYSSLIAADAKDLRAKRDMRLLLTIELDCEEHAVDPDLAEKGDDPRRALERGQEIAKQKIQVMHELLEAKPDDADLKLELAATEVHLSALQTRAGKGGESSQKIAEALAMLRSAAHEPKASPHNVELAFSALHVLVSPALHDAEFQLQCARRGVELTHHKAADWLLMLAEAYGDLGDRTREREAAQAGLALLPPADAESREFRVRKLLVKASD